APVFSIIGCDLFPTSLIFAFFLCYHLENRISKSLPRRCFFFLINKFNNLRKPQNQPIAQTFASFHLLLADAPLKPV
ncbi:hypothetical protein, partial [Vibrio parahaemolyticus]|uniref:hypothetical protein n=1 Tax=Vibrio parahaemolyticus TaxID=670 RepID=UPI001E3ED79C